MPIICPVLKKGLFFIYFDQQNAYLLSKTISSSIISILPSPISDHTYRAHVNVAASS